MFVQVHVDSIGSFAGSIIIFIFGAYALVYSTAVRRDALLLSFAWLQLTLFLFLLGHAMYVTATQLASVRFWTQICYAGTTLTIYTGWRFAEAITGVKQRWQWSVYLALSFLLTMAVFLPGEWLFLSALNPVKSHSSLVKGHFFLGFVCTVLMGHASVLFILAGRIMNDPVKRKDTIPLLLGLAIWFVEAAFDGIFAAVLSLTRAHIWFGPTCMAFCISIYTGKQVEKRHRELERVKIEKEILYKNLIHDGLTRLYTREYLEEVLRQKIANRKRKVGSWVLLFIDIDHFKSVNDELGHKTGDAILIRIGELLRSVTRKGDIAARYGGDEFILLLENCLEENAVVVSEKIQSGFKDAILEEIGSWGRNNKITLSIGIIASDHWSHTPKGTIHLSDLVMYQAKKDGKNNIKVYSPEMKRSAKK